MPEGEIDPDAPAPSADEPRVATAADLDGLVDTLGAAFRHDPVWRWALPDPSDLADWWRLLVASALRYPWVWVSGDYAAVSVWIPPGGKELTAEEEERVEPFLEERIGDRAPAVIDLVERFAASHPREPAHYYLSLLGVHPDHRGEGLGMALLGANLRRVDAGAAAAYLESSNPANVRRYEGVGFEQVGSFTLPDESARIATMWRPARSLHATDEGS